MSHDQNVLQPMLEKTFQKIFALKLMDQSLLVLICLIRDMGYSDGPRLIPNIKVIYIIVTQCQMSASVWYSLATLSQLEKRLIIDSRHVTF